jgi:hypothetical protein
MRKRTTASDNEAARVTEKEKRRRKGGREHLGYNLSQSRNNVAVGAHCGRTDQGPEMDLRRRSRLVERTEADMSTDDYTAVKHGRDSA